MPTAACTCFGPEDATEAFERSEAVFLATVTEVCDYPRWYHDLVYWIDLRFDTELVWQVDEPLAHLAVDASWKGVTSSHEVLRAGWDYGGGCGYSFTEGHQYLIYAGEYQGSLVAGLCTGTKRAVAASEDLDFLAGFPQLPRPEAVPQPWLQQATRCWSHWKGWRHPFARWASPRFRTLFRLLAPPP